MVSNAMLDDLGFKAVFRKKMPNNIVEDRKSADTSVFSRNYILICEIVFNVPNSVTRT